MCWFGQHRFLFSRSNNQKCASTIYRKILSSESSRLENDYNLRMKSDVEYHKDLGQKILLYTLGSKHPAFSFESREKLTETARSLIRVKEGAEKILVAAAPCHSPAFPRSSNEEVFAQAPNHPYPTRASCTNPIPSPSKKNPVFNLQVTWSDLRLSHIKHTTEDFVYLHNKVGPFQVHSKLLSKQSSM